MPTDPLTIALTLAGGAYGLTFFLYIKLADKVEHLAAKVEGLINRVDASLTYCREHCDERKRE